MYVRVDRVKLAGPIRATAGRDGGGGGGGRMRRGMNGCVVALTFVR